MKLIAPAMLGLATARSLSQEWMSFKAEHGKIYSPHEETRRFNIFKENKAFVDRHNADFASGKETYTVTMNKFADLTNKEFHATYLGAQRDTDSVTFRQNYQCKVNFADNGNTPDSVDWTSTANPQSTVATTHVKDQGSCGSCWSFGGAGTYEGAQCLAGNYDCSSWNGASEQQLVDCGGKDNTDLGNYYDMACNGGWIDNALYYIMVTGYIDSEDSYPYVSGQTRTNGACTANPANALAGTTSTCGATKKNSETDLQGAVAQVGPIGIAIDAGGIGFQLYSGGVYTSSTCSSTSINHAVLAAGYGSDSAGTPYWTVKNSWGTGWGDNGYILMRRNYGNMCAVASTPAYAIMD